MISQGRVGRSLAAVALVALVGLSGCLATTGPSATPTATASDATATATATPAEPPAALDSRLAGLVAAQNRSAYATDSGLDYESDAGTAGTADEGGDGRVRGVVVLEANATLPEGYDLELLARADGLVEVRVAVDDLHALASEDGVRQVRPPRTPGADATGGVDAS